MVDRSNGYEKVAEEFLACRGSGRSAGIGAAEVREWARRLPQGAAVIDLGCGAGFPLTEVLVAGGLEVFGVDAAPSMVAAFRRNFPGIPVACEAVQDSMFFGRSFAGVLAWGLLFLLDGEEQERLIRKMAAILEPGGRLLFTAPARAGVWDDMMTGMPSRSLGAVEYRRLLAEAGVRVVGEYEDAGQNYYFEAVK